MYVKFVLKNSEMKCRRFVFQFTYLFPLLLLLSETQPNSLYTFQNNDQMSFTLYNWKHSYCKFWYYLKKMVSFASQVYLNEFGISLTHCTFDPSISIIKLNTVPIFAEEIAFNTYCKMP